MGTDELLARFCPIIKADDGDRFLDAGVRIYGRVMAIGFNRRIVQYWLAWSGDRDHSGTDWEIAMIWIGYEDVPDAAVYAAHRGAARRSWKRVPKEGDHPIVFSSRDKHSSRFRRGWHRHGLHLERCNGKVRLDAPLTIGVPAELHRRLAYRDPVGWFAGM